MLNVVLSIRPLVVVRHELVAAIEEVAEHLAPRAATGAVRSMPARARRVDPPHIEDSHSVRDHINFYVELSAGIDVMAELAR